MIDPVVAFDPLHFPIETLRSALHRLYLVGRESSQTKIGSKWMQNQVLGMLAFPAKGDLESIRVADRAAPRRENLA